MLASARNPPPGVVLWPSDGDARRAAIEALRGTREAWERAYVGAPAGDAERALPVLLAALGEDGKLHPREAAGDDAEQRRATAHAMIRRRSPMKLIVEITDYPERSVSRLRKGLRDDRVDVAPPVGR
ncbi:hypothetical protein [Conexibacter sp. CPCC 206217]|uniref:hypothetical protein n=1 Tax=Conexibacter sp. CPCC 206217 TaxID=3064574 RepID=UPI00272567B6|nr:hypothetical protein [Conexibacter sp. CPCC 206217]MDO8213533.1 hypothetical protein [Conexibacter sp. CPCC 206217]